MNEIYRVLKPNGYFLHRTPAFPAKQAFSDPTHVKFYRRKEIIRLFSKFKTEIKFYSSTFSLNICLH